MSNIQNRSLKIIYYKAIYHKGGETKYMNLKRILTTLLGVIIAVAAGFALTDNVHAQAYPQPFVFMAEQPTVERPTIWAGQMKTIQLDLMNFSLDREFNTTVCATDMVAGQSRHLGCIPDVKLSPRETLSFSIPRIYAIEGTHVVKFSYQDPDTGEWHGVLSPDASPTRATFQVI